MSACVVCEGEGAYAKVEGSRPLVFVTCARCSGSGEEPEGPQS